MGGATGVRLRALRTVRFEVLCFVGLLQVLVRAIQVLRAIAAAPFRSATSAGSVGRVFQADPVCGAGLTRAQREARRGWV